MIKNIKRYSNNFDNDIERYVENRKQIAHDRERIDFLMNEIKEAIADGNWFYVLDIMENNLFYEYINRNFVYAKMIAYVNEHGADDFISKLSEKFSSNTDSYVFALDFMF